MKPDLTAGSIWKNMFRFSLPFLLSYFLQTLYGMADLYIIGQFCSIESTTAVAIGSQVMHMLTVMIVGLSMGSVVAIGQAVGARDCKQLSGCIGTTVMLFLVLSAAATALLLMLVSPIVRVMAAPEAAAPGAEAYLRICFLGIPFITAYNVISSILRGMGDSKTPMYFIAVACIANIALDYLFIGYFRMGAAGAALGTTLAQTISVLLALLFIRRQNLLSDLSRADFRPERQMTKKILKIGLPVALQEGFIQISFIIVTIFANLRGLEDAAAVGIVEKLIGLLFLVPSSMLQTVSTMSAQNIGAGKHDRVLKILRCGCLVCLVWGLSVVVVMHFHAEAVIGLFSSHQQTVHMGCQYLRSYVWDCVFAGLHFCFSGYFCAYGRSALSFLHNAAAITCVRIPLSYYAATHFKTTLFPMGLASTAGSLFSVVICLIAYRWLRCRLHRQGTI